MQRIDVNQVLDTADVRGLPLVVVLCTTLILVLDGLDIQIMSLVAPQVAHEFHISPAALGPTLGAAILGMACGGFTLGSVGDRWGRRPTLLISVALFAASTLLGATITSIPVLAGWRFLAGIGLGGAVPNAMALLAEFTGPRWRTQAVAAACIGVPAGGMSGAVIAAYVLPQLGWRAMFLIGGTLPFAALAAAHVLLPESPRFLVTQLRHRKALVKTLNRLAKHEKYAIGDDFELSIPEARLTGISPLVARHHLRDTCGIWIVFLTNMFVAYTFFGWTPVILGSLGLPLALAVRGSIVFNLAGVCGGAVSAGLLVRSGSRWPMSSMAALAIFTFLLISRMLGDATQLGTPINLTALMAAFAAAGFAMIGIQTAAYRLTTHLYPTPIRSSGVGWAAGFGRIGGILSSSGVGWLLARVHGAGLFAVLSGAVLLTVGGILLIRRHLEPLR